MLKSTLLILIAVVFASSLMAQDYPNSNYPFITEDLVSDYPFWFYADQKFTIAGAWGVGLVAQLNQVHLPHVHVEAGYAFMLAPITNSETFDGKSFRPWADIYAGYPVLTFKRGVRARYTTTISSDKEYFYRIKAPVTTMIIPQVGFRLNPYPFSLRNTETNNIVNQSVLLPTLSFGVKVLSLSAAMVSIRDKETGNTTTGATTRMSELYIGMIIPLKEELEAPDPGFNGVLATGPGFEVMLKIPFRHNSLGTFNIGLRSTGYSLEGFGSRRTPTAPAGQIVIGNSFYLN